MNQNDSVLEYGGCLPYDVWVPQHLHDVDLSFDHSQGFFCEAGFVDDFHSHFHSRFVVNGKLDLPELALTDRSQETVVSHATKLVFICESSFVCLHLFLVLLFCCFVI